MINEELLQTFPSKRIKPIDGMAVTADVWEEAHDYHRYLNRFHTLLYHGTGIVTGLEVIASDPPDTLLYILPGIAVDSFGQAIVIPQAVGFDFDKKAEGPLHLLLTYDESRPRGGNGQRQDGPLYVHEYFSVQVAQSVPDGPYVELARIRRVGRDAPIMDAADPQHPAANEIDLRFRRIVGLTAQRVATIGVTYLGQAGDRRHGLGMSQLARALSRNSSRQVQIDDDVPLSRDLSGFTIVALTAHQAFQLRPADLEALRNYIQGGGTLFIESCRRDSATGDVPSDRSFTALVKELKVKMAAPAADHPLLNEPYLFAAPPPGFETKDTAEVQVGDGVIWSTCDYTCLWEGKRRDKVPSREEIRSAMEWGSNIVEYALERRAAIAKERGKRAVPSEAKVLAAEPESTTPA